jgi:LysR family glycine cleavage system transcriptional activator
LIGPQDEWWALWFKDAGVPLDGHRPRGGIRLDSQANEGHAAMAGQGLALLTPLLWRGDLAAGRLTQPFALTATAGYAYWLAYPPERRMVPKVKRFREWLLASIRAAEIGEP